VGDFVVVVFEPSFEEVFEEKGAEVADVGVVIDGGAAGVEFDVARG